MKKNKGVVIIAVILACLIGLGYYTTHDRDSDKRKPERN